MHVGASTYNLCMFKQAFKEGGSGLLCAGESCLRYSWKTRPVVSRSSFKVEVEIPKCMFLNIDGVVIKERPFSNILRWDKNLPKIMIVSVIILLTTSRIQYKLTLLFH